MTGDSVCDGMWYWHRDKLDCCIFFALTNIMLLSEILKKLAYHMVNK